MPTPSFIVTCLRNDKIADGIYEVELVKPKELTFEAGQFLLIDVPSVDDVNDIQPRAYSIASSPNDNTLLLVIKLVQNGRASAWVEQKLKPNDVVRIQCPFGKFILNAASKKEYVMLCTSTGIAPFRSQLRTILPQGEARKIDLFFGLLHEKELFWEAELKELADQYPNFSYHISISNPSDTWQGHTGYVQQHAEQCMSEFTNKQIYICGAPIMTKAVKETAISVWGIPKEDVHMEGFI